MAEAIKYGFYTVNPDYLEYLNQTDSEVYYNTSYRNSIKLFVGIIVGIESYNYFIPISSAKEKHKRWKNVSDEHFLIYGIKNNFFHEFNSSLLPTPSENPASAYLFSPPFFVPKGYSAPWKWVKAFHKNAL